MATLKTETLAGANVSPSEIFGASEGPLFLEFAFSGSPPTLVRAAHSLGNNARWASASASAEFGEKTLGWTPATKALVWFLIRYIRRHEQQQLFTETSDAVQTPVYTLANGLDTPRMLARLFPNDKSRVLLNSLFTNWESDECPYYVSLSAGFLPRENIRFVWDGVAVSGETIDRLEKAVFDLYNKERWTAPKNRPKKSHPAKGQALTYSFPFQPLKHVLQEWKAPEHLRLWAAGEQLRFIDLPNSVTETHANKILDAMTPVTILEGPPSSGKSIYALQIGNTRSSAYYIDGALLQPCSSELLSTFGRLPPDSLVVMDNAHRSIHLLELLKRSLLHLDSSVRLLAVMNETVAPDFRPELLECLRYRLTFMPAFIEQLTTWLFSLQGKPISIPNCFIEQWQKDFGTEFSALTYALYFNKDRILAGNFSVSPRDAREQAWKTYIYGRSSEEIANLITLSHLAQFSLSAPRQVLHPGALKPLVDDGLIHYQRIANEGRFTIRNSFVARTIATEEDALPVYFKIANSSLPLGVSVACAALDEQKTEAVSLLRYMAKRDLFLFCSEALKLGLRTFDRILRAMVEHHVIRKGLVGKILNFVLLELVEVLPDDPFLANKFLQWLQIADRAAYRDFSQKLESHGFGELLIWLTSNMTEWEILRTLHSCIDLPIALFVLIFTKLCDTKRKSVFGRPYAPDPTKIQLSFNMRDSFSGVDEITFAIGLNVREEIQRFASEAQTNFGRKLARTLQEWTSFSNFSQLEKLIPDRKLKRRLGRFRKTSRNGVPTDHVLAILISVCRFIATNLNPTEYDQFSRVLRASMVSYSRYSAKDFVSEVILGQECNTLKSSAKDFISEIILPEVSNTSPPPI